MKLLVIFSILTFSASPRTVSVTITTSVEREGELHLAVYDSDRGFQSREEVLSVVRPTTGSPLSVELELPAEGAYALAAFHDLNGNGKLDTNVFGVPTEPYGFSKVPPSKWREPAFAEIATPFKGDGLEATISLRKWKEY